MNMRAMTLFAVVTFVAAPVAPRAAAAYTAEQVVRQDTAAVSRLLDSARALRLPEAPLQSLLAEGRQRNEPADRVLAALRRYIGALHDARTALGTRATSAEIEAGASVLLSGAPVSAIRAVRAAKPSGDVTVALVVLADLVDRGVAASRAEDAVVTLARVGATDAAFNDFRASVQRDLADGLPAESSLLRRTREAVTRIGGRGGRNPDQPQMRVTLGNQLRAADTSTRAGVSGDLHAILPITHGRFSLAAGAGVTVSPLGDAVQPYGLAGAWASFGATDAFAQVRVATSPIEMRSRMSSFATGDTLRSPRPDSAGGGGTTALGDSLAAAGPGQAAETLSEIRLGMRHHLARFTVDASTGLRVLAMRPLDTWSELAAAIPISESFDIVGGVGALKPLGRGAGGTVRPYSILGVRWHLGLPGASRATLPELPDIAKPAASVHTTPDSTWMVVIAPRARRVEVAGDFSAWEPMEMQANGGDRWTARIEPRGALVSFRVRVDGGDWFTPPGVPRAQTAFGDEVGVLIVNAGRR